MATCIGHDAAQLVNNMAQATPFVRCENHGISHKPLECTTADDIDLAIQAFSLLMDGF